MTAVALASGLWHQPDVSNFRSIVVAIATLLASGANAQQPDGAGVAAVAPRVLVEEPTSNRDADFAIWLAQFRAIEIAKGVDTKALDITLSGLHYSPRVVELDRAQPDDSGHVALFSDYVDKRVEPVRIARGNAVHTAMATDLAANEAATGVPAAIVLGIWGMESSYGAVTGTFDVPRSLATLAFDGRRRDLFTHELEATVAIVASGSIARSRLTGSWAGAMGQSQFLPSSYLKYARDGDHDGQTDIWESRADVALSIATFLSETGWRRGQGWGLPIILPSGFDRERVRNLVAPTMCPRVFAKHSRWLSIATWRQLGLISAVGWPADETLATLVEPDGPGGRAFLTFGNFRVLLAYNCSNFYALSVGLLGDALH